MFYYYNFGIERDNSIPVSNLVLSLVKPKLGNFMQFVWRVNACLPV
jgi:hypothetical protein